MRKESGTLDWSVLEDDACDDAADLCVHGRSFSQICVQCCPEDDDGSETGEDWSE